MKNINKITKVVYVLLLLFVLAVPEAKAICLTEPCSEGAVGIEAVHIGGNRGGSGVISYPIVIGDRDSHSGTITLPIIFGSRGGASGTGGTGEVPYTAVITSPSPSSSPSTSTTIGGMTDIGQYATTHNACSSGDTYCYTAQTPNKGFIDGLRFTLVDRDGNRIAGTKSIDIIQNKNMVSDITEEYGNLGKGLLSIDRRVRISNDANNKSRNEIVKTYGTSMLGNVESSGPEVYYWSALPRIRSEWVPSLNDFFLGLKTRYPNEYRKIFEFMGKSIDTIDLDNTVLLIEPLMYMDIWTNVGTGIHAYFYGTATEVYYMSVGFRLGTGSIYVIHDAWSRAYPLLVHVSTSINGAESTTSAGLIVVQPTSSSNYMNYMKTLLGLSSGHYTIRELEERVCIEGTDPRCTPRSCDKPEKDIAEDCTKNNKGGISDVANWSCIFSKRDDNRDDYSGQYYNNVITNDSNPYCTVACIEQISYEFPTPNIGVYNGYHFYVGSAEASSSFLLISPVKLIGVTTCRTGVAPGESKDSGKTYINYAKFGDDYKNANNAIPAAWDNLQKLKAENLAATRANNPDNEEYQSFITSETKSETCTTSDGYTCKLYWCSDDGDRSRSGDYTGCEYKGLAGTCAPPGEEGECGGPILNDDGRTYTHCYFSRSTSTTTKSYVEYTATASYGDYTVTKTNKVGGCEDKPAEYVSEEEAQAAYNAAVAARDNVYNKLLQCNNFIRTYTEFDPQLNFSYGYNSDGTEDYNNRYRGVAKLSPSYTITASTKFENNVGNVNEEINWTSAGADYEIGDNDAHGKKEQIDSYICNTDLSACTLSKIDYPVNSSVTQTTRKEVYYRLDNKYQYVNKAGISFDTEDEAKLSGFSYKNIGYGNIPVAYTNPTQVSWYYISFTENIFGSNQKYVVYNKASEFKETRYWCTYKVKERIMIIKEDKIPDCDGTIDNDKCCYESGVLKCPPEVSTPEGLNLLFRPISLSNPFPGESGDGRVPGENWRSEVHIGDEAISYRDAFITYNRNVVLDEIYTKEPMYSYVLTPANIRNIRKYNSTNNYNDFDLSCENGVYCKSTFLRMASGYYYNRMGGTCEDADKLTWESCRY